MFPTISGKPFDIECTEQAFPEFPELLFGTHHTTSTAFFDATAYLKSKGLSLTIQDFFRQYEAPIKKLQVSYNMDDECICIIDKNGHFLIDGNLSYLFISFVEPDFLAYMCDRIHELFSNGVCVSDTYLFSAAKNRLTKDILETILENEQNQQQSE